jgi:prepilin-type N-terminal cleavage/methylation domain-containing protein
MVLKNKFNSLRKDRGFTIVELLIVIVVIAILAAIVIVAYSGITARANLQKSVTNATAMRDVAEAFNADNGKYPALTTDFTTGSQSTKLPAGITPTKGGGTGGTSYATLGAAVTATTTVTTLSNPAFVLTGTATTPTGGVLIYWDPTTTAVSTSYIFYGAANASSTNFVAPAS